MADAAARGPGAEHHKGLIAQCRSGDARRCEQCAGRDRRSALDVVVESAQAVAIANQDAPGIGAREIFPLQQYMRPAPPFHGTDKLLDEIIVIGTAHPLVPPSDINGIRDPLAIVGAGVEQNGQGRRRVQVGAGGIERELGDRNAHAARALIAETQYSLAVADDDRLDVVETGVGEDVRDMGALRPAEEQPARVVPGVAELLAALPNRRRIDERRHFAEVARQQRIEQCLVGVLQPAQEYVAVEVANRLEPSRELIVESTEMRRQQAVQSEGGALVVGKGRSLVQQRIGQQCRTFEIDLDTGPLGRHFDGHHMTRTSTVPTPEKLAQARSSGASGNWRTSEPVITTSPARRLRPYSPSLRASHTTEFSGWSSTAAPTPVATTFPFSSTRAST